MSVEYQGGKIYTYMTEHPMLPRRPTPIDVEPEPLYLPLEEPDLYPEPPPEEEEEEASRVIVIEMGEPWGG